jgi:hypothetical protein
VFLSALSLNRRRKGRQMKAPYFVEILARNGDVLHRHRLQQLPIRIGRGYDNDVILDDAHSAASHASIEMDEHSQLLLRDLGSKNGSYNGGKRCSVALDGDTRGAPRPHAAARAPCDFPVAPEMADTTMHGWEGAARHHWPGADRRVQLVETWFRRRTVCADPLPAGAGLQPGAGLLWAAHGHWPTACSAAMRASAPHLHPRQRPGVMGVWRLLSTAMAYAWDATVLTRYGNLVMLAIACGMVFFHLLHHQAAPPAPLAIGSGITYAASAMLLLLPTCKAPAARRRALCRLLPPQWHHSADRSVDQFMADAAALHNAADAARSRGSSTNDDEDEDSE